MKNKLNWEIFSKQERHNAIESLKRIICSNDGYILTCNFFSDLALSMTVEIEERKIEDLQNAFRRELSISELDDQFDKESMKEWWLFINVNFSKGTGDFKVDVPEFQG